VGTTLALCAALFSAGTWALASLLLARLDRRSPPELRPSAAAVNFFKNALAWAVFLALWCGSGEAWLSERVLGWLLLSGLLGFTLGDTMYFAALPRAGVQTSAMVGLLNVPLAAILGWVWLGQQLSWGMVGAMGVVLGGVMLVVSDRYPSAQRHRHPATTRRGGVLLAFGAALTWALAVVAGNAAMQGQGIFAGGLARLSGGVLSALLLAAGLGLASGGRAGAQSELGRLLAPLTHARLTLLLLPVACCASLLSLVPFHFAMRELTSGMLALLVSTTPLFTLPLAKAFGEPRPGKRAVVGTIVGLAGVVGVVLGAGF